MRMPAIALSLLAIVVAGTPFRTARADDAAAPAPKPTIQWVEGWEAGRAAARERGKLMLVYVHRVNPG